MIILKIIFLFVGIWFSMINISKIQYKQGITFGNLLLWAIGVVGFIVLQFNLLQ